MATNTSQVTRVSLDFRLLPGDLYEPDPQRQPKDFRVGEYYSECHRVTAENGSVHFDVSKRGFPYWRHGFPHTNR